jgi:hypothetical protein
VCGILGTYDIAVDAGRWTAMSDALAHRGPDAVGTWTGPDDAERVRLGYRRHRSSTCRPRPTSRSCRSRPKSPKLARSACRSRPTCRSRPKSPRLARSAVPKPPKVRRKDRRPVGDERAVRAAARIGGSAWCPHATRVADRSDGRRARGRDWRDSRPLGRLRHEYRRTGDRCHNRRTVIFRLWSSR